MSIVALQHQCANSVGGSIGHPVSIYGVLRPGRTNCRCARSARRAAASPNARTERASSSFWVATALNTQSAAARSALCGCHQKLLEREHFRGK